MSSESRGSDVPVNCTTTVRAWVRQWWGFSLHLISQLPPGGGAVLSSAMPLTTLAHGRTQWAWSGIVHTCTFMTIPSYISSCVIVYLPTYEEIPLPHQKFRSIYTG